MDEHLVLVDADGAPVGTALKLDAHRRGLLHRAVSVLLFDDAGRVLLQRRSDDKYHSGGLWSNTCCGHPRPGEQTMNAAHRRLAEEMGLHTGLARAFTFSYRAEVGGGLVENEVDHVFVGFADDEPKPDPREVSQWRWMALSDLQLDLEISASRYTVWLPPLLRGITANIRDVRVALRHARRRAARPMGA
jgi:isopentenyl-diphosphate delta-isomerase